MPMRTHSWKVSTRMLDMHKTNVDDQPEKFDLNLLRFLRALLDMASVTRAGEALGISQPAASRAIAHLRRRFGDPLLVRTRRGYVLTSFAEQLAPTVRRALAAANAVFDAAAFVPALSTRRFRIVSTDYGTSTVLLGMMPLLRREAATVALCIDPWTENSIDGLERGEFDCALYADAPIPPDLHVRSLFRDGYVLVCRAGHPLGQMSRLPARKLLAAAAAYPQFAPRYPLGRGQVTDNVYATLGLAGPKLVLEAPYFYAGAHVVLTSDLVAIIPERAARTWASDARFAIVPLREAKLGFEYRLVWHERAHRDTGFTWLRDLVVRSLAPTGG